MGFFTKSTRTAWGVPVRILAVLVKDLAGSLEDFGVGGLGRQKSFQSSGAAERNAAYPTSGTLLVRATGTRTNGRDMHA